MLEYSRPQPLGVCRECDSMWREYAHAMAEHLKIPQDPARCVHGNDGSRLGQRSRTQLGLDGCRSAPQCGSGCHWRTRKNETRRLARTVSRKFRPSASSASALPPSFGTASTMRRALLMRSASVFAKGTKRRTCTVRGQHPLGRVAARERCLNDF